MINPLLTRNTTEDMLTMPTGVDLSAIYIAVIDAVIHLRMMESSLTSSLVKGNDGDEPASIHTRKWVDVHGNTLTASTMSIAGRMRNLTIVALPKSGTCLPILSVDVATTNGGEQIVAADVVPLNDETFAADNIMRSMARRTHALQQREHSDPSHSPRAISFIATLAQSSLVTEATVKLIYSWSRLEPLLIADVCKVAKQWCSTQQKVRNAQSNWTALFGADIVDDYLTTVLFPTTQCAAIADQTHTTRRDLTL
jgi:hypothetical protein